MRDNKYDTKFDNYYCYQKVLNRKTNQPNLYPPQATIFDKLEPVIVLR